MLGEADDPENAIKDYRNSSGCSSLCPVAWYGLMPIIVAHTCPWVYIREIKIVSTPQNSHHSIDILKLAGCDSCASTWGNLLGRALSRRVAWSVMPGFILL